MTQLNQIKLDYEAVKQGNALSQKWLMSVIRVRLGMTGGMES